jgi:hypothetical protein
MSYLRIRMLFAASFLVAVLLAATGCSDDRRGHVRDNRGPERYERNDDHRRAERYESDRHEGFSRQSAHDRGNYDGR